MCILKYHSNSLALSRIQGEIHTLQELFTPSLTSLNQLETSLNIYIYIRALNMLQLHLHKEFRWQYK